jgi:hypothetical protein
MRRDDVLVIEHVRCHEWLRRYRDRFAERCPALTAEQLDELITPEAYVDLASEIDPETAADTEMADFMITADLPRD